MDTNLSENSYQSKFELMLVAPPVALVAVRLSKIFWNLNTLFFEHVPVTLLHLGHLTIAHKKKELVTFNMLYITVTIKCITIPKQISEIGAL